MGTRYRITSKGTRLREIERQLDRLELAVEDRHDAPGCWQSNFEDALAEVRRLVWADPGAA